MLKKSHPYYDWTSKDETISLVDVKEKGYGADTLMKAMDVERIKMRKN